MERRSGWIILFSILFSILLLTCTDRDDWAPEEGTPTIDSLYPGSGKPGILVTIKGRSFSPTPALNIIGFNGIKTTALASTGNELKVVVPQNALSGPVSVIVNEKVALGPDFEVIPANPDRPFLSSVSPLKGNAGTLVDFTGNGFDSLLAITFNMLEALLFPVNDSFIQAIVPKSTLTGPILLTFTDTVISGPVFEIFIPSSQKTQITNVTPNSGLPGTSVTIIGSKLSGLTEIYFNNTLATIDGKTDTLVNTSVPVGATSGPLKFVFTDTIIEGFNFTVPKLLKIDSIAPASAQAGEKVLIYGTGFGDDADQLTLTINGNPVDVVLNSEIQLEMTIPTKLGSGNVMLEKGSEQVSGPYFTYLPTWYVATLAGNGSSGYIEGTGTAARFNGPIRIELYSNGDLLVADVLNHAIRYVTEAGEVFNFAGGNQAGWLDGPASTAQFNLPFGLAIAPTNVVYVADYSNHVIRAIDLKNNVSTIAGILQAGFNDAKDPLQAQFNSPADLTFDASGNLYIADYNNHRIRKMNASDGAVSTLSGSQAGFSNGGINSAAMNGPVGISYIGNNNLLVMDYNNHAIRQLTVGGMLSTRAGTGSQGFTDGNALSALFDNPYDADIDADGNIYIADAGNHAIRILTTDNQVITFGGTGASGYKDGKLEEALFNGPSSIAINAEGIIYVADFYNHCIRKIYQE